MLDLLFAALIGSVGIGLIVLQVACIVHAIKTGRPFYWLWILFAFPMIGVLAYIFIEFRPSMGKVNWEALRWKMTSQSERIRIRRAALQHSNTIKNRYRLAEELLLGNQPEEACQILREGMTGVFSDDAELMLRVAESHLECKQPDEASQILSKIQPLASHDFQFQYKLAQARVLAAKHSPLAESALRGLMTPHRNEGPHFYLARYLFETGREAEAKDVVQGIQQRFRKGTSVWRFQEQAWYQKSKKLAPRS